MTSENTAQATADLTIEVYTTPGRPFASAATPEGPGDLPTWSPSSATLIYGDRDAILVDTLITYDQVDALADWIDTKGRGLSRIYITHGHGDPLAAARSSYARLAGVDPSVVAVGSQVSVFAGLIAANLPGGSEVLTATGDFTSILFPSTPRPAAGSASGRCRWIASQTA